jgi:hypothetical protein
MLLSCLPVQKITVKVVLEQQLFLYLHSYPVDVRKAQMSFCRSTRTTLHKNDGATILHFNCIDPHHQSKETSVTIFLYDNT